MRQGARSAHTPGLAGWLSGWELGASERAAKEERKPSGSGRGRGQAQAQGQAYEISSGLIF